MGSNPITPTKADSYNATSKDMGYIFYLLLLYLCYSNLTGGCSSVGRASAFQAECREFESRRPLKQEVLKISEKEKLYAETLGAFLRMPM